MTEIRLGPERVPLDRDSLVHVGDAVGWARRWADGEIDVELRIAGDDEEPDAGLVEIAEMLLPKLAALESAADAYLRHFVRTEEQGFAGAWSVGCVTVERGRDGTPEIEARLAIGEDDYGEWTVRFRHYWPTDVYSAYWFARKQW